MDESFIKNAIDESKAKENLLNAVTELRAAWYWCQSAISDTRLKDASKYISEGYPFNDSVEEVDIKSWCDALLKKFRQKNKSLWRSKSSIRK